MNFTKNKPIYLQIAHEIILEIYNHNISLASIMPSVRELSVKYQVTPKTIQAVNKHLNELEVITTKPGVGSVITADYDLIKHIHKLNGKSYTLEYIESMKKLSYQDDEIINYIRSSLKGEHNNDKY